MHLILHTSYLTNCLSPKNAKMIKRSSTGVFPWIASLWTTDNWIHKSISMRRHQRKLDYKTIMDRLWTVSWIDSSYLPGEIKLGLKDPPFPPSNTVIQLNGTHIFKCFKWSKSLYAVKVKEQQPSQAERRCLCLVLLIIEKRHFLVILWISKVFNGISEDRLCSAQLGGVLRSRSSRRSEKQTEGTGPGTLLCLEGWKHCKMASRSGKDYQSVIIASGFNMCETE